MQIRVSDAIGNELAEINKALWSRTKDPTKYKPVLVDDIRDATIDADLTRHKLGTILKYVLGAKTTVSRGKSTWKPTDQSIHPDDFVC